MDNRLLRVGLKESFFQSLKPLVKQTCIRYAAENFPAEFCINDLIQSLGEAMEQSADEMQKGDYCVHENL